MAVQPPSNTPMELILLLGKIDGKVDGIATTLAAMDSRADNHEKRLHELERADAARATYVPRFEAVERKVSELESTADQGRGFLAAGGMAKAAAGLVLGVIAYFGYEVAIAPASPPAIEQKTVQTTTIPVEPTKVGGK